NEREENAQRKIQNRDAREWDKEKEETGWNSPRQQRKSSEVRYSPNNPYVKNGPDGGNDNDYGNHGRRDSRGNNDYGGYNSRNNESGGFGSRNYRGDRDRDRGDNEYRRSGPRNSRENNDYRNSRENNDYAPRNSDYGGSRGYRGGFGDRGRGRGGNVRRPTRRYSDQHRSNKSAEEGGFGSGNSWAEQQEQEEMSGKTNLPWESDANAEDAGWGNSNGTTTNNDDGWGERGNSNEHS
ncbi:35380_t:CDS:2, partial [Racocetra persica]